MTRRRSRGRPVHGWLVIDKPEGLTSTQALARARRLLDAEKAGHGGTLDPLATGVLPLAFGEATKTVSFAMDGRKVYRFTLRWGEQRTTDDREGAVSATSDHRPDEADIHAALPGFIGEITQVPPCFSAIRIDGARAYDLARAGEMVEMAPRQVHVERFSLVARHDADHAEFEVVCGKGTYMRALARDLALAVGTVGHISALRRLSVGRFTLDRAISLDAMATMDQDAIAENYLLPIETALDDIPALALSDAEAHKLRQGQTVALLSRQDRERLEKLWSGPAGEGAAVLAVAGNRPVALVRVDGAEIRPVRVLNL